MSAILQALQKISYKQKTLRTVGLASEACEATQWWGGPCNSQDMQEV